MPVSNTKTFDRRGPSDVFLLNPDESYEITTVGAEGGASDVHVYEADNDLASAADASLATNWNLLQDTGVSGDLTDQSVTAGTKKIVIDVQDPLVDGGVVVTVKSLGALTQDAGMNGLNNQRQKDSSARRFVNSEFE